MKNFCFMLALLLLLGLTAGVIGNEQANSYFPSTLDSYWIYENQHGQVLARHAIEPEKVDGEMYNAFSYTPFLANPMDFEYYVHPHFYQITDDGIAFFVGTEAEKALKATTTKQLEHARAATQQLTGPRTQNTSHDIDLEVESQAYFHLLPTPFNEEWTAIELNAVATITINIEGFPAASQKLKTRITYIETGNVTGTETVETQAGIFEDCLVVEYRADTITETDMAIPGQEGPVELEDVTVTKLWLAPNVGIVKFEHRHTVPPGMEALPIYIPEDQTLELIQYQIQPANSEVNE